MNYEDFYQELQPHEKNVKDDLASPQKLFKSVNREMAGGDIKNLSKDLDAKTKAVADVSEVVNTLKASTYNFDAKNYFESGEFAEQMLAACEEKGVDVRGEFPVYEMFPYRIKLDLENQDLYMDRKKVQCMRPKQEQ